MEQKQMFKQFYCKMEKGMRMFVEHAEKKGTWICTNCRYTTSNPEKTTKMPETNKTDMDIFWENLQRKSSFIESIKSC